MFNTQSKLQIGTDADGMGTAQFQPNFSPATRKGELYERALAASREFEEKVVAYLGSL